MTEQINTAGMSPHAIIVEDESALTVVYAKALEAAGYYVQVFNNGSEALEHLKKVSPRLLLLDLSLPGANGEEILEAILDMPAHKYTKIFLISSNARLARHLFDKVDIVLEKPVRYKLLCRLAEKYKPKRKGELNLPLETNLEELFYGWEFTRPLN